MYIALNTLFLHFTAYFQNMLDWKPLNWLEGKTKKLTFFIKIIHILTRRIKT